MPLSVDLNADLGESFGRWTLGDDRAVLECITSANVACGGHAGDPDVMRRTVRLARDAGVAVGAHPGFADLAGFGRRELPLTPLEVENLVLAQVGALTAIAAAEGVRLQHVKPHGALYNMAVRDRPLAEAIARAVHALDADLLLFAAPGSELQSAGAKAGLAVTAEGFADRSYEPDGSLTPRSRPGAVIEDADVAADRAVRMVRDGVVASRGGEEIPMRIGTLCVHGDTPGAALLARRLHEALTGQGIKVLAASGL
jgi:5-oxoprolinase (ATP-hydrolysing) subunit A